MYSICTYTKPADITTGAMMFFHRSARVALYHSSKGISQPGFSKLKHKTGQNRMKTSSCIHQVQLKSSPPETIRSIYHNAEDVASSICEPNNKLIAPQLKQPKPAQVP